MPHHKGEAVCLAGAVGIEPTQAVLETAVLPLYDAPRLFLTIIPI